MPHTVRVWDLPTRLFHWGLALCVVGLVITGHVGGAQLDWHARIGYAVLTLLLFRLVWGVVGGHWSRFSSFVAGPARIAAYLRGELHPDSLLGHNPLGALSVLAMLALLLVQVGTGLVGDDESAFTGPLNKFVTSAQGLAATWYHKRVGQWVIVALVLLHVAAVLFYRWKKGEDLVRPMVHGDKAVAAAVAASRDDAASRFGALAVLLACGAAVAWLVQLGS
ncbi:cytochrome b/b6 domain-containing protein [Ramlibacter sp.]|uniref:cytochrome b/b6 domain-containing protein n=1 Tax=Ramlibacter sp. TaxID=1917967 RepID=UPI002CFD292F|nr:cytochrome b/b6 domain-containing protein [Ramlibacter sp.]HWI82535.1 cytochrome b/b6 domain-containing protein [Ramlibacter sp.]